MDGSGSALTPSQLEFLSEDEQITIIPTYPQRMLQLMSLNVSDYMFEKKFHCWFVYDRLRPKLPLFVAMAPNFLCVVKESVFFCCQLNCCSKHFLASCKCFSTISTRASAIVASDTFAKARKMQNQATRMDGCW